MYTSWTAPLTKYCSVFTWRSVADLLSEIKTKQNKKSKKNKQNTTQQEDKSIAPTSQFIPKKIIWVILILLVTEKRFLEWAVNVLKNWKVPELENMNLRTNPYKKRPLL